MKKALILTYPKFQDVELIYTYYKLQEDFEVFVASNQIGLIYGVNGVKINSDLFYNTFGIYDKNNMPFDLKDFDLLVMVGGVLSVEYARQSIQFIKIIKDFYNSGKIIASICHAAQYLIEAEITKGKRISGYYSIKKDIENSGATFVDEPYVIDGNIITCPHYKYQTKWMQETVKLVNEYQRVNN